MIQETYRLTATNTDVLAAPSRLNSVPYDGTLTIELAPNQADATNNWTLALQLANGDVPVDSQLVPRGNNTVDNIDDRMEIVYQFDVAQGGHTLISLTLAGTAQCWVRITLTP